MPKPLQLHLSLANVHLPLSTHRPNLSPNLDLFVLPTDRPHSYFEASAGPLSSDMDKTKLRSPPSGLILPALASPTKGGDSGRPAGTKPSVLWGLSSVPSLPEGFTVHGLNMSAPTGPRSALHLSKSAPRLVASQRFTALSAAQLAALLMNVSTPSLSQSSDAPAGVLVLDIRSHSAFLHSRLRSSISVCVPSTLLRRPAYGIDRIADSLTGSERASLLTWPSSSTLVIIDSDSTDLVEGGGVASMLAKFERAGYAGQLAWVQGGYSAIRSEAKVVPATRQLLISGSEDDTAPLVPVAGASHLASGSSTRPILQVRNLPIAAFQQASTSTFVHAGQPSATGSVGSITPGKNRMGLDQRRKTGSDQNALVLDLPRRVAHLSTTPAGEARMATNPFFDNIRQNSEALSLTRSLANLAPVDLITPSPSLVLLLPPYLSSLLALSPLDRAQQLARQFYDLEVAERERLEGTMHWHAHVQAAEEAATAATPTAGGLASGFRRFGISAGVELGHLNRYKNIFPYDHARVRLESYPVGATDYINASHVSLASSPLRFIASQGPLPSTYRDFWQMCAQEEIGVIVMLTNVFEGGREKCGRYWEADPSGEWEVVTTSDESTSSSGVTSSTGASTAPSSDAGGFFDVAKTDGAPPGQTTIRRTIHIKRRSSPPGTPLRKIRHIQYVAWPDFDVPADPHDLVSLIREVDTAQQAYLQERNWSDERPPPPVVTMCSAGIGRTGVFILVATLLDKLKRDRIARGTASIRRRGSSTKRFRASPESAAAQDRMDFDLDFVAPFDIGTPSKTTRTDTGRHSPDPASPGSVTSETSYLAAELSASTLDTFPEYATLPQLAPNSDTAPLMRQEPILAALNELREQRMSMVGNYRQYVCVVECTLVGAIEELEIERAERGLQEEAEEM